jgi:hypothetical protein
VSLHLRQVSRRRPALAQDGIGFDFDLVSYLGFVIRILTAVDGLFQRKNEQEQ